MPEKMNVKTQAQQSLEIAGTFQTFNPTTHPYSPQDCFEKYFSVEGLEMKYSVRQAVHPHHAVTLYTECGGKERFCNNFFFRDNLQMRQPHCFISKIGSEKVRQNTTAWYPILLRRR